MKKIITLCLLVFALCLSTESAIAQSNQDISAQASEKTEALKKFANLNHEQCDQVYLAFMEYTKKMAILESADDKNEKSIEKVKRNLETKMQTILSSEQYARYQEMEL
ncbi:hypothetical protein [Winogradskyella sp.]|uniref:hypothetical protein n=1 Tax=Winogradskyella sp. TaxID=1883156 RepID=UPI0026056212|nr:hypothetical protein [Winogradskyella sp.]